MCTCGDVDVYMWARGGYRAIHVHVGLLCRPTHVLYMNCALMTFILSRLIRFSLSIILNT